MSDTSVKSLKEDTFSNNDYTYLRGLLRPSLGGMEGIREERNEQQSDRPENHNKSWLYLGRPEVEKVRYLM